MTHSVQQDWSDKTYMHLAERLTIIPLKKKKEKKEKKKDIKS